MGSQIDYSKELRKQLLDGVLEDDPLEGDFLNVDDGTDYILLFRSKLEGGLQFKDALIETLTTFYENESEDEENFLAEDDTFLTCYLKLLKNRNSDFFSYSLDDVGFLDDHTKSGTPDDLDLMEELQELLDFAKQNFVAIAEIAPVIMAPAPRVLTPGFDALQGTDLELDCTEEPDIEDNKITTPNVRK